MLERKQYKLGKYDILAQPAPGSMHMLRYTVLLNGKRLGALLSAPTESDCRFLEAPPKVPPLKIFSVTYRPGRPKKDAAKETADGESTVDDLDALFDETGHWCEPPQAWPDQVLQEKQFLQALEKCLAALPARTSQVFMMREHLGFDTDDICKELGITATHCW